MKRLLFFLIAALFVSGCQAAVLAADDFTTADPNRWFIEQDHIGRGYISGGMAFLELRQANTMQYMTLRNTPLNNFVAQVEGTLLDGSTGNSYGLLIRKQEGGAFYRFAITGNGYFSVDRHDLTGNWQSLMGERRWESNAAINTGIGSTNQLKITAVGNIVIFEVNGVIVYRNDNFDNGYQVGDIALSAGTFSHPISRVAFDNLIITEP